MKYHKNLSLKNIVEEFEGIVYEERWKNIWGYGGAYLISDFGRIKSMSKSETVIKKQRAPKNGYLLVSLWKQNKEKKPLVHRLVAKAFIENKEKKKTVNHKFGIKEDNRFHQLEWSTMSENVKHSFDILKRKSVSVKGAQNPRSIPIVQLSLDGKTIRHFESINLAAQSVKTTAGHVAGACAGKYKTAKKYKWQYA